MNNVFGKYLKGDKIIWIAIFLLSIFSLLAVYSSTGTLAFTREGYTTKHIMKHAILLLAGLGIIYFVHRIPYRYFFGLSQIFLYVTVPLLLVTLLLGVTLNEADRWLRIPVIGLTFQTSDLAKIALIMYIARTLSQKQDKIRDFKTGFVPMIIPIIVVCLLILPANFSTAAILFATCMMLLFIGRVKVRYLLALMGVGIVAVALFISIALAIGKEGRIQTWKTRVESYMSGDSEDNYQAVQAKIAIATGGIKGKGPGNSTQRYFLPHPYSDFIYAIVAEEYGLLGAIILLFMYLYLLYRAGVIVRKSERTFPAFLSVGLTLMIVFQAMINMAVAVNLLPVTGQTLPLVSMGGSSLLFTSTSLGIILSVSRTTLINETSTVEEDEQEED